MSEKTMVTIDCDLVIPEGTEKVFENQHITLEAGIRCNGKVIFRDCKIEPIATQSVSKGYRRACKPGCIEVSGTLQMEGCEVIRPGRGFLSFDCEMNIKNTSFLKIPCSDSEIDTKAFLTQCVIIAREKVKFEGCSFVGDTGTAPQTSELALIKSDTVIMDNCVFENIIGRIEAGTISSCSFTGCASIESVDITDSTFTDCKSITANSGCFRNCDFIHVEDVSALSADMDNCRFQNIENDREDEGIVFLEDSKMMNCTFDGADLRNGSYLICGVGDIFVEDCQFSNCYTDRDDRELCHREAEESSSVSVPMGLLKGVLKLAGSAALGATGVVAAVARQVGDVSNSELLTSIAGAVEDASFEGIRSMWGMDDAKIAKMVDSMDRDELAGYVSEIRYSLWELDEDSDDEDPEREAIIEFRKKIDAIEASDISDTEREVQIRSAVKLYIKTHEAAGRSAKRLGRIQEGTEFFNKRAEEFQQRREKELKKLERERNR